MDHPRNSRTTRSDARDNPRLRRMRMHAMKTVWQDVVYRNMYLTGGIGTDFPNSLYYIQPRTLGLSISNTF